MVRYVLAVRNDSPGYSNLQLVILRYAASSDGWFCPAGRLVQTALRVDRPYDV